MGPPVKTRPRLGLDAWKRLLRGSPGATRRDVDDLRRVDSKVVAATSQGPVDLQLMADVPGDVFGGRHPIADARAEILEREAVLGRTFEATDDNDFRAS